MWKKMANRSSNQRSFSVVLILMFLTSLIFIIPYLTRQSGIIEPYNPEESGFWGSIEDDVLIYGFYDDYKFESGFNETYYALMKNKILSVNDQGVDDDQISDLLIQSSFLLGNEKIGIEVPQVLDISLVSPLLSLLTIQDPLSLENIILPTLPAFHFVNSKFIDELEVLSNLFFLSDEIPTHSFEYEDIGDFPSSLFWDVTALHGNKIEVEQLFGERNVSRGLKFSFNNYTINATPNAIQTKSYIARNSSGQLSFWFYPDKDNQAPFLISAVNLLTDLIHSNGVIVGIRNNSIGFYEGKKTYFDNGLVKTWIDNVYEGNFTVIGNLVEDEWNHIKITFLNNLTNNLMIQVNNNTYEANYSVENPALNFQIDKLFIGQIYDSTHNGEDTTVYFDDLTIFFQEITQADFGFDIPILELLGIFSAYSSLYFPIVFNYDAFYDLIKGILRYIDGLFKDYLDVSIYLEGNFTSIVKNNDDEFIIELNSDLFEQILNNVGDLFNIQALAKIQAFEGDVDWNIKMTWDKNISCLNSSVISISYNDLNAIREVGMKLIVTRSPNLVQDTYTAYNSTWYDSNYVKFNYPLARLVSALESDIYPSEIPSEWDVFNLNQITEDFLSEFEFDPIMNQLLADNVFLITFGIAGLIAGSVGVSYGIFFLVRYIQKRRSRSIETK
jgi:hypothetical protein